MRIANGLFDPQHDLKIVLAVRGPARAVKALFLPATHTGLHGRYYSIINLQEYSQSKTNETDLDLGQLCCEFGQRCRLNGRHTLYNICTEIEGFPAKTGGDRLTGIVQECLAE